jgi:hypothetical protein
MPRSRLPDLLTECAPRGITNQGRPLKRLLEKWDRNRPAVAYFPQSEMWWWWLNGEIELPPSDTNILTVPVHFQKFMYMFITRGTLSAVQHTVSRQIMGRLVGMSWRQGSHTISLFEEVAVWNYMKSPLYVPTIRSSQRELYIQSHYWISTCMSM